MDESKETARGASPEEVRAKLVRCLLALLLAASSVAGALSSLGAKEAHAAETAYLSVGGNIPYAGFFTTWMWADGQMAYCAQPSKATPSEGGYEKAPLSTASGRDAEAAADLWFGWGGPGFDYSMWPRTWYDGTPMNDARYAALTHIILSDTYSSSGDQAMHGCTQSFRSWCQQNVLGFDDSGSVINGDATGRLMYSRMGEVKQSFKAFQLYTGSFSQMIVSFSYTPYGSVELEKQSGNDAMSGGNNAYSLAAEYTLYSDEACTQSVSVMALDDSGRGRIDEVEPGNYWLKESKAAPGFAIDEAAYAVTVEPDKAATVAAGHVQDTPQSNAVDVVVAKADATTEKAQPQGDSALSGAEFTVEYYKGIYSSVDEARASGSPERTWVLAADDEGKAHLNSDSKVSGDAFYYASDGTTPVIPLGTVLVTETKAPCGYNLDDGRGNAPETHLAKVESDNDRIEAVSTYNSPVAKDTVKRGDYRLVKEVPVSIYSEGAGDMPQDVKRVLVPGVEFQLIDDSANPVASPETGEEVAPGGVVCTITTDGNGLATTKDSNAEVNGWEKPEGWSAALAYGTYSVHEVIPAEVAAKFKAEYGKTLLPVDDFKITVSDEGQYNPPVLVSNKIPQTPLKVVKADAETGKRIPLAASFELYDADGDLVTYTLHYPDEEVVSTWTTNERGELTLPMVLGEGCYFLKEVAAPEGYVLDSEPAAFSVSADYRGWDDPIVLTFEDAPQKGTITVSKTDSETGSPVDGSTYIVKAEGNVSTPDGTLRYADGQIVATLITGADGRATSEPLYLGTYTVYEAKTKDGYALDIAEKSVALTYQGQEVSAFDEQIDVTDAPTELQIVKVSSIDGETPIEGATFRIWNDSGDFDETLTTDAGGIIALKYLKHGRYHMQEVAAADGYVVDDVDDGGKARIHDFEVNDQGMVAMGDEPMQAKLAIVVENMPKTMGTTATDGDSGAHEGQARSDMSIIDSVAYTGCIPGETYKVTGKLMDKSTDQPVLDAEGNEITVEKEFSAEGFEGSIDIEFRFDGSGLAGASLVAFESMFDAEGNIYMSHEDISDEGQTVNVVGIATKAHDAETGTNQGTVSEAATLVDEVSFKGLTPGNRYKLFTMLVDKATGEPVEDVTGNPMVIETDFEPEAPDGTVEVVFELDTTDLAGKSFVFFEKLADDGENVIAKHEDIGDEGQTIELPELDAPQNPVGKGYPKTGADAAKAAVAASAAVIVGCGAAGAAYAAAKRRNKAGEEVEKPTAEPVE